MIIDDTLLYLGGLSAVLVIMIIYIMLKDAEQSKKVRYLEHSIDKLHNQLYTLESEFKSFQNKTRLDAQNQTKQYSNDEIAQMIKQEVGTILGPISQALNDTETSMKEFQSSMQNRFDNVENHVKQTVMMPQTSKNDEDKIVSMYKNGYSIDEIAKHFRIGAGEVELIIKFSSLNNA